MKTQFKKNKGHGAGSEIEDGNAEIIFISSQVESASLLSLQRRFSSLSLQLLMTFSNKAERKYGCKYSHVAFVSPSQPSVNGFKY
jgi:hypothetical protein